MWNSTFKSPAKPMQRKTPMKAAKPMARSKTAAIGLQPANKEASRWLKSMKSRGMKGKSATSEQRYFHGLLADVVGCIACRQEGMYTDYISIHHIDGRTKPDAHWLVLGLCAGHHQDGTGAPGLIAVHPWKKRFETKYGSQHWLARRSVQILRDRGLDVPAGALAALGMAQKNNPATPASVPGLSTASI